MSADPIVAAIRRTRMARVSAGVSRETAAADHAYATAALLAIQEHYTLIPKDAEEGFHLELEDNAA